MTRSIARLPILPILSALAAFTIVGHSAKAQENQEDQPGVGLEEIIVTALKREQNLFDAPIAVSAFTGEDLEAIGANKLADFLQSAPGVAIVDAGTGDQRVYIRGLASTFGDSPVGYYLDEVPFSLIGLTVVPDVRTFDLERVEVLRGPQGTLYGASSLGGTVRILTRDPVLDDWQTKVDLSGSGAAGGGENYGVKAALNVPLVDERLALRLVGTTEDYAGWLDNPATGQEDVNDRQIDTWRAKLRWVPSDRVELILGAWTYDSKSGASALGNDDGAFVGSVVPFVLNPGTMQYDLASAELTIGTEHFDIVSSTSYMDLEAVSSGALTSRRPADTFAQEIRLSSNGAGPWAWTAGVYYRDLTTGFIFELPPFPPTTQDTASESYAVFGELTYALTDEVEATVGLRYFEDTRDRADTVIAGVDPVTFEPIIESVAFEEEYSTVNPRFNLAWRPSEDILVYTNIAKGFRSGFTQPGISLFTAEQIGLEIGSGADEEIAWSYEIGAKAQLADHRVALETAVYYIDWDNLQTVISVVPGALGAIVNAGKATAIGLDFGITAMPVAGLELALTGNVNESEYGEDVFDTGGIVVAEGQQIQLFPALTLSASANYRWDIGSSDLQGVTYFRIGHTSERTLNFGSVTTEGDKITQATLRLGLQADRWGVYLFADNLFDEDGKVNGPSISPNPVFNDVATRLRPRTIGLNVQFNL